MSRETCGRGWQLRYRADATGFVGRYAGQRCGTPFDTLDEAETVLRMCPNGEQMEIEERTDLGEHA